MTEQNTALAPANNETNETNETTAAPANSNLPKTLQDVSTTYFKPAEVASAGVAFIQHVAGLLPADKPVLFNGDWAVGGEFPAGYGILVLPLGKQVKQGDENKRVTEHIVVAAIPTVDVLMQSGAGSDYIADAVQSALATKLRNSFTRVEDKASVKLPVTVEDFITKGDKGAADQGLAAYKKVGPRLVAALKSKGIELNIGLLRQVLQSAAFASALMPGVKQTVWEKVIAAGKIEADKEKLPVTVFDHWLATRAQAASGPELEDIEFDA